MVELTDDWVPVEEDYPQIAKGYTNVTDYVLVLTSEGNIKESFYAFNMNKWIDTNGNRVRERVVAWQSK